LTRVALSPDRKMDGPVPNRRQASIRRWAALLLPIALTASLAGCAPRADVHGMPAEVASAPRVVREAYDFAVAHPEVLTQLPCYCGCGAIGHTSNYACYVSGSDTDGTVRYDLHATGCSICVDITRDAMRLLDAGRSPPQIRAEIDRTYAAFGPSNMP
jgi:hypothetical protein